MAKTLLQFKQSPFYKTEQEEVEIIQFLVEPGIPPVVSKNRNITDGKAVRHVAIVVRKSGKYEAVPITSLLRVEE